MPARTRTCSGVFRNATDTGLGQLFTGIQPFHLAIQPYIKNYQVFGCPSDDIKGNAAVNRTGIVDALKAAGVPGANYPASLRHYRILHSGCRQIFPDSYGSNLYFVAVL